MMKFSYVEPTTLGEAVSIMSDLHKQGKKAKYLAGGTDLIPLLKQGVIDIDTVVNLKFISGLNNITEDDIYIRIGPLARLNEITKSTLVNQWAPAVAIAAGKAASPGLRNMGTIGGNVLQGRRCWYYNQSKDFRRGMTPCYARGGKVCYNDSEDKTCRRVLMSDLLPALILDGAMITLASPLGNREVLLETLVNARNGVVNVSLPEVISEIKIPKPEGVRKESYQRMSIRRAIDYPEVSVAIALDLDLRGKKCRTASVVVGSVCPGPFKSVVAPALAQGSALDKKLGESLGEAVADEVEQDAVEGKNFSKWYKIEMIKKMVGDAVRGFCGLTEGCQTAKPSV